MIVSITGIVDLSRAIAANLDSSKYIYPLTEMVQNVLI